MAVELLDGTTGFKGGINSDKELSVALTQSLAKLGYAGVASLIHSGNNAVSKFGRGAFVGSNSHLRVGTDVILFRDVFNHAIVPNDVYAATLTTMTTAVTANAWRLNEALSVASGATALVQSYRTFEVLNRSSLTFSAMIRLNATPQANNECLFGLGIIPSTGTPTDGAYFRYNGVSALEAVVNFNGTEITQNVNSADFSVTAGQYNLYEITIDAEEILYRINGTIVQRILKSQTQYALGSARSWRLSARNWNSGAVGVAQRLEIVNWSVVQSDCQVMRTPRDVAAANCLHVSSQPRGVTTGGTANYTNNAAPASATLSNTAAGYVTIGGQFQFASIAGAETDYALFAFLIPAPTAVLTNRNLFVKGIRIDTYNIGAIVATNPNLLQWALGVGGSAISLATNDSTGTRAARRIPLGVQTFPIGAAIGAVAEPINRIFETPIMVEPATYLHIMFKMPLGAATASQFIRGIVAVDAYWE